MIELIKLIMLTKNKIQNFTIQLCLLKQLDNYLLLYILYYYYY